MWVRGYVSTAFGSPFGDTIDAKTVVDVASKLIDMGCDELSVGDTIGVGVPSQVDELVPALLQAHSARQSRVSLSRYARHRAANIYAALLARRARSSIQFCRRPGRMSLCPGRNRERRYGRRAVSAAFDGHRNRRRSRQSARRVTLHRQRVCGHTLTSKTFQALEASDARAAARPLHDRSRRKALRRHARSAADERRHRYRRRRNRCDIRAAGDGTSYDRIAACVTPGLVNAHVHLEMSGEPELYGRGCVDDAEPTPAARRRERAQNAGVRRHDDS